ncbi:carbamoyltransferase HypF [Robiginitalea sediminis]|uniref:carbamoyltransferase HypF n=1 Tax=Robiginitalea sediminis TaxID=1982593 RepID=UPI0013031E4B|nr:carbamoyltransferase HypF [Robiginitalea sediminis]
MNRTYRIVLQGRVQGVGFRPFVCREASRLGLFGTVSNNEEGVLILATGPEKKLQEFYTQVTSKPPPLARIHHHDYTISEIHYSEAFRIVPSETSAPLNLQLTPDFALCPECAAELQDPQNRRWAYPFTSCVKCGPRWSVTRTFPFEREHTSMEAFPQCPDCLAEYTNPTHRRFHSQTNSCPTCGIGFRLRKADGTDCGLQGLAVFEEMGRLLESGAILAIENQSGFLLCCDAAQAPTIRRLREQKQRPVKPFALLYPSLERLEAELSPSPREWAELLSPEHPIVLLSTHTYTGGVCLEEVAPGLDQLGVMLPYSGVLELLSSTFPQPIIATSGNLHGSPICHRPDEAREKLRGVADYFFEHDLEILHPQDDSVVRYTPGGQRIMLRRSRGFAPNAGAAPDGAEGARLLAMGADLKSTLAYLPNGFLYLSEYLGNLTNYEVYNRFSRVASGFTSIFNSLPKAILADAHPGYHSTHYGQKWAQKLGVPCHLVQHHMAHFAALLGEHNLLEASEPILGVVWDGTGYGTDGHIWGGEFFDYSRGKMTRQGHVEYFDWLAGDKMSREPRLSLLAIGDLSWDETRRKFRAEEWQVYQRLLPKNRVKSSSVGRLFDAVASLTGLCDHNTFEGEAAMKLEAQARAFDWDKATCYAGLTPEGNIPARGLLTRVLKDRQAGVEVPQIIGNFMYTLARIVFEKATRGGYSRIGCSGGVFQNAFLVEALSRLCEGRFQLILHRELPPNDENIAYGQLMYHLYCNR